MLPSLPLLLNVLSFLQGEAPAQDGATGEAPAETSGGGPDFLLLMIALVAVFYFVMILPEKKNRRKREAMLGALKKGDLVMTTSGLYGTVVTAQDDRVTLEVADKVRLRFSRAAIQTVLNADEQEKEKSAEAAAS